MHILVLILKQFLVLIIRFGFGFIPMKIILIQLVTLVNKH